MAHEVESMFYTERQVPWHGLGTPVKEALKSADALRIAGLDWDVVQQPVFLEGMSTPIPNYKANVRSSDNAALGIVSDRYRIVQNKDAFDFTDSLIDSGEVFYETAGSLKHGRTIWLLAKMPEQKILDDKFDPYLCFANSHDGTGAIKVMCTPVRVVCNNTLNFALATANRAWTCRHVGDIKSKLDEAKMTIGLANKYNEKLAEEADRLANEKIDRDEIDRILDEIFPVKETDTDRKKANVKAAKDEIMICYMAPDIAKFLGTKYGFMNAISDWCSHSAPARKSSNYQENNWGRVMNGHPVFDAAYDLCVKGV